MPRDWEGRWSPYEYNPYENDTEELEENILVLRLKSGETVRDEFGDIVREVRDESGKLIYRVPNKRFHRKHCNPI